MNTTLKAFCCLLVSSVFFSCAPAKLLNEGDHLLKKNKINIQDVQDPVDRSDIRYELSNLLITKTNRNWLWVPREWFYLKLHDKPQKNKVTKFILKRMAEKPAIYDSIKTAETANRLEQYLKNKKGFYNAEVDYKVIDGRRSTFTEYDVSLFKRSYVHNSVYIGNDFEIIEQLIDNKSESFIKKGTPIDALIFDLEKQRIINFLQNQGYAYFNNSHIAIKGDSTNYTKDIEIFIEILNPTNTEKHKRYRVGEINVITDKPGVLSDSIVSTTNLDNRLYQSHRPKFLVKPKTLNKKVFMTSGEIYSKDKYYKTIRKLTDLSSYKFVKVNPYFLSETDTIINYNIQLSPQTNKWIATFNVDNYYSTLNNYGIGLGGTLQNRNVFRGSEVYSLSADAGVELNLNSFNNTELSVVRTALASVQNKFSFPKLIDIYQSLNLVNSLNIISDNTEKQIRDNAETDFNLGINYNKTFRYNTIVSFNFSYGFDYRPNQNNRVIFNQTGVDLILYTQKDSAFIADLENNQLLANSFNNSLFTGIFFQKLGLVRTSVLPRLDMNLTSIFELEVSGLEIATVNAAYNGILNKNELWQFSDALDYANFIKLEIDERFAKEINDLSSFAFRFTTGVAFKYFDDQTVPYVRQFFNGGPSSIRAWQPRELGPGSYSELLENPDGSLFYQAGDFKMEASFEYRFDLPSFFEGALFLDAGNIWTLSEDADRPGSVLSNQFYKQIAVGAGYGIRMDFSFLIIRFDFGYKLRNPYIPVDTGRHWINLAQDFRTRKYNNRFGNLNIAINYPF